MVSVEQEAQDIDRKTVSRIATSGTVQRALLLPASMAVSTGGLGRWTAVFSMVAAVAVVMNGGLAWMFARAKRPAFIDSPLFFALDVGFAVALNLLATAAIPRGTVLETGRDVFWQYALGTVVVWTSLRGVKAGVMLCAGGTALEAAMIVVNGAHPTTDGVVQAVGRVGWLVAGLLVPAVIVAFATKGTRLAHEESRKGVQAVKRTNALADLHDTALQSLTRISGVAVDTSRSSAQRLDDARRIAAEELSRGSTDLRLGRDDAPVDLRAGLEELVAEFEGQGLSVALRDRLPQSWRVMSEQARAFIWVTREALNNVLKYANVDRSLVVVSSYRGDRVALQIIDKGCGFDAAKECAGHRTGFGHMNMRRRMQNVGGTVEIYSVAGRGTKVKLTAPAVRSVDAAITGSARRGVRSGSADVSLQVRALGWFVLPALTYRACLSPLQIALAVASLPHRPSAPLLGVALCIFLLDLTMLAAARSVLIVRLFSTRTFVLLDFALAAFLNLWVALDLPDGTALIPGRQFMWGYAFGTVILWTALHGPRLGALMTMGGVALEATVILVNQTRLTPSGELVAVSQAAKLVSAFLISWLLASLARRGVALAERAGDVAGRQVERADDLFRLYEGALDALARIVEICDSTALNVQRQLRIVRGMALRQTAKIRAVLHETSAPSMYDSLQTFDDVVEHYQESGIRVEVVTADPVPEVSGLVAEALAGSARAALQNVLQHARVTHVVVWISCVDAIAELVIRDQGAGFALAGTGIRIETRIAQAGVASLGGTVRVWSEPGRGTRVTITVPMSVAEPHVAQHPAHPVGDPDDHQGHGGQQQDQSNRPLPALAAHAQRAD